MSNLKTYDSLLYKQDSPKNVRYPPVANNFIYFYSIIDIKIGYLKLGIVLFNSSFKTYILKIEKQACFFSIRQIRMLVKQQLNHLE